MTAELKSGWEVSPGRCPQCEYDLRGATTNTCSECGADAHDPWIPGPATFAWSCTLICCAAALLIPLVQWGVESFYGPVLCILTIQLMGGFFVFLASALRMFYLLQNVRSASLRACLRRNAIDVARRVVLASGAIGFAWYWATRIGLFSI